MEIHFFELETYCYFFLLAVVVLGGLYLNDLMNDRRCLPPSSLESSINNYDYRENSTPLFWKQMLKICGQQQSPINILENMVKVAKVEMSIPLIFSKEFHVCPAEMKIYNNSTTVVLYGLWPNKKRPTIFGGPLSDNYHFVNLRFRWGHNDYEGSEHMINSTRFAMELQAAFVKSSSSQGDIFTAASKGELIMLGYVFMVTTVDNPYLEPLINAARYLKRPMSYLRIEPIFLSFLLPEFSRDYYTYVGSLTFPPFTEGVRWIVKPEPLMISSRQVKQFRKLYGYGCRIETNTRPVQPLNQRGIEYYN